VSGEGCGIGASNRQPEDDAARRADECADDGDSQPEGAGEARRATGGAGERAEHEEGRRTEVCQA
jgi:hypothetical protein